MATVVTLARIDDLCYNTGNFTSICSKFSQFGCIKCDRDESHHAHAYYDDNNSMVIGTKLRCVYGKMAIDMLCQIHEIVSIAGEIKQIHVDSFSKFVSCSRV